MGEFFIGLYLILFAFIIIPLIYILIKSVVEVYGNIIHDIFKKGE